MIPTPLIDADRIKLLLLAAAFAVTGCEAQNIIVMPPGFRPDHYDKIAVIVEDLTAHDHQTKQRIEEQVRGQFNQVLLSKGYRVATRSDIDAALEEIKFASTTLTENNAAVIGKMIAVPAVMIVQTTDVAVETIQDNPGPIYDPKRGFTTQSDRPGDISYQARCEVSARLINVERGEILWQVNGEAQEHTSGARDIGTVFRSAANDAIKRYPPLKPTMTISSKPQGADVLVNGTHRGQTPQEISFDSYDEIHVVIEKPGYHPWKKTLKPMPGGKEAPQLTRMQ